MSLFRNKYRVESARLPGWDYAASGFYFVTLCTRDRQCCLGRVVNGVMKLSAIGEIVAEEWQKTPTIRAAIQLDEWIIMPNHVHGIIVICHPPVETSRRDVSTPDRFTRDVSTPNESTRDVSTPDRFTRDVSTTNEPMRDISTTNEPMRDISKSSARLKPNSLGSVIGQFKSVCTKRIWASGRQDFAWQPRFHDRIIRDENALQNIRAYIKNNPAQWEQDRLFTPFS